MFVFNGGAVFRRFRHKKIEEDKKYNYIVIVIIGCGGFEEKQKVARIFKRLFFFFRSLLGASDELVYWQIGQIFLFKVTKIWILWISWLLLRMDL